MPLVAGAILPFIGYKGIFWGAASLIVLSIPLALAMKITPAAVRQAAVATQD